MGKAFYRKYRSKSLSEVVGQSHITDALQAALKAGAISHAYLFTGPRGVGKTSVARIWAHEINQLPYSDDESSHLDIIEIDAASNRRIDEIRDLKDKVHTAPTSAKYKVYIIDEVHMLTKEAFNALLKTLEEPPAHVVFILATTEAHKLPETIISRTQRFTFRPVGEDAVVKHLAGIAKQEGIDIDAAALKAIADHGEGSFRDSISLLDQMRHSSQKVTELDINEALGIAPKTLIDKTVEAIQNSDRTAISAAIEDVETKGVDTVMFAHQLSVAWRKCLLEAGNFSSQDLALLDELARVGSHPNPAVALDIALYRPLANSQPSPVKAAPKVKEQAEPAPVANEEAPINNPEYPVEEQPTEDLEPMAELPPLDIINPVQPKKAEVAEWDQVLVALKKHHNTLYGIARMGEPSLAENTLTLAFAFPFHVKRIAEEKNRHLLEQLAHESLGKRLSIVAVKSGATRLPAKKMRKAEPSDHITSVSNIFGGAEIVES